MLTKLTVVIIIYIYIYIYIYLIIIVVYYNTSLYVNYISFKLGKKEMPTPPPYNIYIYILYNYYINYIKLRARHPGMRSQVDLKKHHYEQS